MVDTKTSEEIPSTLQIPSKEEEEKEVEIHSGNGGIGNEEIIDSTISTPDSNSIVNINNNNNNNSNNNGEQLLISKVNPPTVLENGVQSSLLSLKLNNEKESMDNLVKLYMGSSFNSWMGVSHLFKHSNSTGITDFLCNRLYSIEDKDIDFYITQLCVILINQPCEQICSFSSLARFMLDRCSKSIRFAIKAYWIFQAMEEDGDRNLCSIEKNVVFQSPSMSPRDVHQYTNEQITPIDLDKFYNTIDNFNEQNLSNNNNNSSETNSNITSSPSSKSNNLNINTNNNNLSLSPSSPSKLNLFKKNFSNENLSTHSNNIAITTTTTTAQTTSSAITTSGSLVDENHVHFIHPNDAMENINCTLRGNRKIYHKIEAKKELATRMREFSEMSFIKCSRPVVTRPRTSSLPNPNENENGSNNNGNSSREQDIFEKSKTPPVLLNHINGINSNSSTTNEDNIENTSNSNTLSDYDFEFEMTKSYRCDYFNEVLSFVQKLSHIAKILLPIPADIRQAKLKHEISLLNIKLPLGLYLPLWQSSNHHCIVRIPPEEVKVLNSRERVPYLLVLEIIESEKEALSTNIFEIVSSYLQYTTNTNSNNKDLKLDYMKKYFSDKIKESISSPRDNNNNNNNNTSNNSTPTTPNSTTVLSVTTTTTVPLSTSTPTTPTNSLSTTSPIVNQNSGSNSLTSSPTSEKINHVFEKSATSPFGESWEEKTERYRHLSPYGHLKNWRLCSVIIKTGDDCRQEQMAVQLISKFQEIWNQARLPLYLRPYSILVTGNQSGIIETIPDTISLHNLKKNTPNYTTLLAHFKSTYGDINTDGFRKAQCNFIESLAAYSIVTYLLQVKDRHNGNILLDREGHIVHIDFGFILSNSPGNISFESAPFKLTQEWVDVMGGVTSSQFQYFSVLCSSGFVEARKNAEKIISLIEIMLTGPKMSCFQYGKESIEQLKQRFNFSQTERESQKTFEDLVSYSIDHYKTRYYDKYQSWFNSIL